MVNKMVNDDPELAPNAHWVHEHSAEVRIKQIDGHTDSINNCQLLKFKSSDVIFTVSNDNTARLWEFNSGKELHVYKNLHDDNQPIPRAKVNYDNSKFVTCSWDRSVRYWDIETGKLIWKNEHEFLVTSCNFSNLGSRLIVSCSDVDFTVKIWDTTSGKCVNKIPEIHSSTITSILFSPKNDRIATTSMDKTCKFYDIVANKTTLTLGSHKSVISNCVITPDERKFATCSWDKTINVWDVSTGMYRAKGAISLTNSHEGSISSCFINSDSTALVSAGYDRMVVLWDLTHGVAKLILRGHLDWINDVFITDDSKWIVSVGKDKQIRQWDVENCDDIRMVVEQNKSLGNKLVQCSACSRLFTNTKLEKFDEMRMICVFCRLENNKPIDTAASSNRAVSANPQNKQPNPEE